MQVRIRPGTPDGRLDPRPRRRRWSATAAARDRDQQTGIFGNPACMVLGPAHERKVAMRIAWLPSVQRHPEAREPDASTALDQRQISAFAGGYSRRDPATSQMRSATWSAVRCVESTTRSARLDIQGLASAYRVMCSSRHRFAIGST